MSEDRSFCFRYDAALAERIESRWQERWQREGTFTQPNPGEPGFDAGKPKFYALDMFPYPSGAGLHVGHPEGYIATDIIARYKRMRGFNVLHPMGWDAFGLPAEQYALQTNVHPAITTRKAIDTFRRQLQRFGFSYDWSREFGTIDEGYYKFTQWIFLQMYGAFFDAAQQKARPIAELARELASGTRKPAFNPAASEINSADKGRDLGRWSELDAVTQRRVIDSYRIAFVGEQAVNWCPKLGTVLANEEVIDGRSERGGFPVVRKPLKQWMLRITSYADRLLDGLAALDWPEATKIKQSVWIGRSDGADIDFALASSVGGEKALRVFTTRPDTIFGATYIVVAPEHPLVDAVLTAPLEETDAAQLGAYVDTARNRSERDRQQDKSKTGVFTGLGAINPATGERIPVWTADYVLMGYGHGAIMAVPAHDERDYEFAQAFGIPIVQVVEPEGGRKVEGCFADSGRNVHSSNAEVSLDGLPTVAAKQQITAWLEQKGIGRKQTTYKLHDWLFSRQRYWGEPFPIVWDEAGNHYPVDASALPVKLPELADFRPEESEEPKPLLGKATAWAKTTARDAHVSGLPADAKLTRELNTMPNWAGSCWYYLRFCDPQNASMPLGEAASSYWLGEIGVDLYVGGSEHSVLHLLYARFWHHVLFDLGLMKCSEPFAKLFHQGLITSFAYQREDRSLVAVDLVDEPSEGTFVERETGKPVTQIIAKMSKSLRNVVSADEPIAAHGADTFRLYEMYMGPLDASKPWNTRDITGLFRFLQRTWRLLVDEETGALKLRADPDPGVEKQLHRAIAKVGADIEGLAFNTAIAALITFVNEATPSGVTADQAKRIACLLAPFAPHMAEEVWEKLGESSSIASAAWPSYEEAKLRDDEVEIPIAVQGKVRTRILVPTGSDAATIEKIALADPRVQELTGGKAIRKMIVVPGKMVNLVLG